MYSEDSLSIIGRFVDLLASCQIKLTFIAICQIWFSKPEFYADVNRERTCKHNEQKESHRTDFSYVIWVKHLKNLVTHQATTFAF